MTSYKRTEGNMRMPGHIWLINIATPVRMQSSEVAADTGPGVYDSEGH